jgi:replicative DNA helicase
MQEQNTERASEDIEIEQAILGGLLLDNDRIDAVADIIRADHFYDGLHQRIYSTIAALVRLKKTASPMSVKSYLKTDPDLAKVDKNYLTALCTVYVPGMNLGELAKLVKDAAVRRGLANVGRELVAAAEGMQADMTPELLVELAEDRLHILVSSDQALAAIEKIEDVAERALIRTEKAFQEPARAGIATGFLSFDRTVGRFSPGDLIVLGGATSMGKTALAQQITWFIAARGHRCMVFSKEMSAEDYVARHLSQISGVSTTSMEDGSLSENDMQRLVLARQSFRDLPIWIDASPNLTVGQMRARTRRLRRRGGVGFILIDHLRFIQANDPRAFERDQLQQITRDIKSMAKELGVPVLLVAHLNRDNKTRENKRPTLSDLYGASAIEQNADTVLFVHRDEYWLDKERPGPGEENQDFLTELNRVAGQADIIVAKRRRGPTGFTKVKFNAERTLFSEVGEDMAQASLPLSNGGQ